MPRIPVIQPDAAGLTAACRAIAAGRPVGLPTETVYGLAADAGNPEAVARIFAAKQRPHFNPLIVHLKSSADAGREGRFDARAAALARALWPGPLTLVVPASETGSVCELARAGLGTIGLRVPAHPIARRLLAACERPLSAPSANPSGRLSPTAAEDVAAELESEHVAMILGGGPSEHGIESSIVAALPGQPLRLLRAGAIARARIEAIAGSRLVDREDSGITAPGQLESHYAPAAGIRLQASRAGANEVLLGFGPAAPAGAGTLSPAGDTTEAAARLYRLLRQLDALRPQTIAVMPIPETGLGEAINDRLRRAAAPRVCRD